MHLLSLNSHISISSEGTAMAPSAFSDVLEVFNPPSSTSKEVESLPTPVFPDTPPVAAPHPCSFNECLSGHMWPAILAVGACPGCTGSVLAVQKTNCPFCNEPATRSVLRSDFIPRGMGLVGRCKGQNVIGESLDIELIRGGWKEAERTELTFLEKEATSHVE